jgi:hypothetical protein
MVESLGDFPFRKIRQKKYLLVEVFTHIDHQNGYKFLFSLNMESRVLFITNFTKFRNGYINRGLIPYCFDFG